MTKIDPAKLQKVSVSLPFGIGSAEWEGDPTERRAAWSLYVELVTRIAVQPLETDQGLLRVEKSELAGSSRPNHKLHARKSHRLPWRSGHEFVGST